ncbi:MAG: hypothetical protein AAFY26_25505, partial [Cyanobacteria bacterium J06638_22]
MTSISFRVYSTNADLKAGAAAGEFGVGDVAQQISYYTSSNTLAAGGARVGNGSPQGGNHYVLKDASPGTRPAEDGGAIIHVSGSATLFLQALFPGGKVNAEQFGVRAQINKTVNNLSPGEIVVNSVGVGQPINNALAFVDGKLLFGPGVFVFDDEIVIDRPGLSVIGQGAGPEDETVTNAGTTLRGTNAAKAVIRIRAEDVHLKGLTIGAQGDRTTATRTVEYANYNPGIRIEGQDLPEESIAHQAATPALHDVWVQDQPGDGVALVGNCHRALLEQVVAQQNGGHGFVLTDGQMIGRTNKVQAGVANFLQCRSQDNDGHGWRIGRRVAYETTVPDGITNSIVSTFDVAMQVYFDNCEGLDNGSYEVGSFTIPTYSGYGTLGTFNEQQPLLEASADSFINCDGLYIDSGVFQPRLGVVSIQAQVTTTEEVAAGVALMGQGGLINNLQFSNVKEPVAILRTVEQASQGWQVFNAHIIDQAGLPAVVALDDGIKNIQVWQGNSSGHSAAVNNTTIAGLDVFDAVNSKQTLNQPVAFQETATFEAAVDLQDDVSFTGDSVHFDMSSGGDVIFSGTGTEVTFEVDVEDANSVPMNSIAKIEEITVTKVYRVASERNIVLQIN